MTESAVDEESIAHQLTRLITVGWRKGVFSKASGEIHSVINSGFFNSDKRISAVSQAHVDNIVTACTSLFEARATSGEIGVAMKNAALQFIPKQPGNYEFTVDNQGKEMLRKLMPIEFVKYGRHRIADVPSEYCEEDAKQDEIDSTNAMREQYWNKTEQDWRTQKYLSEESQIHIGAVLIKLAQEIPAVAEYFADVIKDDEEDFRIKLHEAVKQASDDDWDALASWLIYVIYDEEE